MGELSEFAPYDDSCEPLATEEEAADYNERVHREEEEEQQFQRTIRERCQRMNGMVLSWNVDLYFFFPVSTYPSLNRAREERDCVLFKFTISLLCD